MARQTRQKTTRSLKKLLNYKFDNYIARGVRAQFTLLFIAILLIVVFLGLIAGLISSSFGIGEATWQALMHMLDQGTIGGDDTSDAAYVVVMLIVTLLGMAFTGTIVGIINNAMSDKLDELKKGHSQVIEEGHVVIIGFDNNIYTLLYQMEESNQNWPGNKKIVVVDPMDTEEMEHLVKEHEQTLTEKEEVAKSRSSKKHIVFRSGSIVSENTFNMASIEHARAIIINAENDFEVIRIMLAVVAYLKKHDAYKPNPMPAIVSLMHEKENISAAEIAAEVNHEVTQVGHAKETKVRVLYFEDILAHIFAQVCRQPGLSWVVSEIFDYDDSELYIEDVTKNGESIEKYFLGKTFGEISEMMKNSIAVGIQRGKEIMLNPDPKTTVFAAGDKIIHMAEDDNLITLSPSIDEATIYCETTAKEKEQHTYNILVFGWSVPLPDIIRDIDKYAVGGSLSVITRHEGSFGKLDNLTIKEEKSMDPYDWAKVRSYLDSKDIWSVENPECPTNILILCQDGIDKEAADERAAVLLLNIREYLKEKGLDKDINITTEMNLPENQILLQNTCVNDFIVGSEIANRMMVQVANNPDINAVFVELLSDRGSELYMRDIAEYVDVNSDFTFMDITRHARSRVMLGEGRQEVVLGWIEIRGENRQPIVKMNPQGDDRYKSFPKKDAPIENFKLVVLAR